MDEIQTSEFFAPANTNLLDGLVAEYRQKRSLIERFHGDFKDGEIGQALVYFCQQEGAVYPRFDLQAAICAVNAEYWKKALELALLSWLMINYNRLGGSRPLLGCELCARFRG